MRGLHRRRTRKYHANPWGIDAVGGPVGGRSARCARGAARRGAATVPGTSHAVLPGESTTCGRATLPPGTSSGERALQGRDPLARARHCGRRSRARRGDGRLDARGVCRGPADRVAELQVTRLGGWEMRGGRLDFLCLKIGWRVGCMAPNEGARPPPISCLVRTCARRPGGARAPGQRRARPSRSCRARCGGALRRDADAGGGGRVRLPLGHAVAACAAAASSGRGGRPRREHIGVLPGNAPAAARRSPGTVRGGESMAPPPSPC